MKRFLPIIATFFTLSLPVHAAELLLSGSRNDPAVGEVFTVVVTIDTQGESLNAIEGRIIFPADGLEMKEVTTGDSFVNFWIERPHISTAGTIAFSGITPGGYAGSGGVLFSIAFKVKSPGKGLIQAEDVRMLKNDGQGASADVRTMPLEVSFAERSDEPRESSQASVLGAQDGQTPEPFLPTIVQDPELFSGKLALTFATQDKQSGIDRYEVRETRQKFLKIFDPWIVSESPYLLKDQSLRSTIIVKAVDKAGNEQVTEMPAQYPSSWYTQYENWIALGVIIAIILAARLFL